MSVNIAAIFFAYSSILIALLILPHQNFVDFRIRAAAFWFLGMPALFVINDQLILFIFIFTVLFFLAPFKPDKRIIIFILLIPALPLYLQADIPFPGINYLIGLNYYKVAVLALLVPIIFMPSDEDERASSFSVADLCVITYVLYISFMSGLHLGLTGGLRFLIDQCLLIATPYFALSRIATRPAIAADCLKAFIAAAGILAAISLASTFKQWDFYRFAQFDPIAAAAEIRGGFLRIQATLTTHSLGYHLAAAIVLLEFVKNKIDIGWIRLWALRVMLLGGMYFTGSRGAMVGMAVALSIHTLLSIRSLALRWALIIPGAIFGIVAAYVLMFGNATEYDTYGSFNYRQQLLSASLDFIADHPLFGDVGFLESGRFDHLVQGQGIIDVTNLYLQIALAYGMLGLALFFSPMLLTILRLAVCSIRREDEEVARMCSVICGALIGWLVLVATTSDVGLTLHLGLALFALGHALVQHEAYKGAQLVSPLMPEARTSRAV